MLINKPIELITACVQETSFARDLNELMFIIRKGARKLTSADGVTFVLKDKDNCFYADEDAITPLWKGKKFPLDHCISGWSMLNKETTVIKNIYLDARIPQDVYRQTFVKSLAMIPIRKLEPIGAIGCYWKNEYKPTDDEIKYLEVIADITAIAYEKLQLYNYLRDKAGIDAVNNFETANILFSPERFMRRLEVL